MYLRLEISPEYQIILLIETWSFFLVHPRRNEHHIGPRKYTHAHQLRIIGSKVRNLIPIKWTLKEKEHREIGHEDNKSDERNPLKLDVLIQVNHAHWNA